MNQKLTEALTNLLQSAVAGKDFVVEQAPDVVQQLLTYTFVYEFALMLVGIGIIVMSYTFANKYAKKSDGMSYLAGLIAGGAGSTLTLANLGWIKVWLAPKLFVLEYAASLVK